MIKTIVMLKKREGMSHRDFTDHWRDRHVSLVEKLPGITGYVQNHILPGAMPQPAPFDGVGEAWFRSPEELREMLASDAYRRLITDEENFLNRTALKTMVVREIEPLK